MRINPVENLLRQATEGYTALTCVALSVLVITKPHLFLLTPFMAQTMFICLLIFGGIRGFSAYKIIRYQKRLMAMPYYGLTTKDVPVSKKHLFLGRGFLWTSKHTQRLHQIKQVKNLEYITTSKSYQAARNYVKKYPNARLSGLLDARSFLNPFKQSIL